VVLTVPVMVLVAFAVFVGRYASVHQDVVSASRDAARAAAVRQLPGPAQADGERAAVTTLVNHAVSCRQLDVVVDTTGLHPGGSVTAEVRCVLSIADVAGFGLPGTTVVEASSTAVVDRYRGGDPVAP
jgi:Flp pilus assembly protein TadG